MAKTLKQLYELNEKRLDIAISRVYASATSDSVPFQACLRMASEEVKAEYNAASSERYRLQELAIRAGKAYRAETFQTFTWTSRPIRTIRKRR